VNRVVVLAVALLSGGCGSNVIATPTRTSPRGRLRPAVVAVGQPVPPRAVDTMGGPATVELRVENPVGPDSPPIFATFGRPVRREPRDVCLGAYAGNESPADGDVGCQVRGREPLVLTLGYDSIPDSPPTSRFVIVYGQVNRQVTRLELTGPGLRRLLPLSAHRLFVAAFSPSAAGTFALRAYSADGSMFSHAFALPLPGHEAGQWPGLRRRGAIFNEGIGENIVTQSYEQIIARFGPPLKTFIKPGGIRCIYYDIIGYQTGWTFCFHGHAMAGAAGNHTPPAGAR
jgi:hypothetical protein